MARAWPRSLHGRLLAGLLAVLAVVGPLMAWSSWRALRHELDELLDAHLAQAAALLVVQQSGELEHDDDRLLDAPLLSRYAPRVAFQVFHEGQLVLRSAQAPREPMVALQDARLDGYLSVDRDGAHWRVFTTRGGAADVQVLVAERIDAREHILRAGLRGVLGPLLLALPALALLSLGVVRATLRPLARLRAQVLARQAQALDALPTAGLPSEVAPLAEALNGLFGRIGTLLEAERRFTADAAHELRTPIAAVRAQAQVALAEADDGRRRAALAATLAACDRAGRLIDQLLALARADAAGPAPGQALPEVDLAALARGVVAEAAPQALARGQDLGVEAPPHCVLRGDATLLAVLLRNLVDNALRHGGPTVRVDLRLSRDAAGRVNLVVEDDGPGLPAAARQRLGQRFFRAPAAAASVDAPAPAEGSGLGWSIVRRIAERHGLQVDVGPTTPDGRGLRVALRSAPPVA